MAPRGLRGRLSVCLDTWGRFTVSHMNYFVNRQSKTKIMIARNADAAAYSMRRGHLSPAYTTDWENLPLVR